MNQGKFKPVAEVRYKGRSAETRIILESDKALYTTLGTFLQIGVRWLWVRDLECELKPEVNDGPADKDRQP
jgi:hypothetical protein